MKTMTSLVLAGAVLAGGCHRHPDHRDEPARAQAPAAPPRTTDPVTAVRNMNATIAGLEKSFARTGSVSHGTLLINNLLARTQYLGTYADFARARAVADALVDKHGAAGKVLLARASTRGAVHELDDAVRDLTEAARQGGDVRRALSTIGLAQGKDLSRLVEDRTAAVHKWASYGNRTGLAAALAAMGRFDDADRQYQLASDEYRDVSPMPLAWIAFQRGVMWAEKADDPRRARPFYQQAVRLLPSYVVANVHLAELEAAGGDVDAAVARLERIIPTTEDPEPVGLLSRLLADRDPQRAQALARRAVQGYEHLLAAYPLAFLDHGSELFAKPGPAQDPQRAVELAMRNLEHRRDHRAYLIAVDAADAAGDADLACQIASQAAEAEGLNRNLNARIAALHCAPSGSVSADPSLANRAAL